MMRFPRWIGLAAMVGLAFWATEPARAASLVATYQLQGTLNADQSGVPALTPTNPLGTNGFETTTLYGHTRQVYDFNGTASPPSQQAGLTFDNSGSLIPSTNYSAEIVFEFTQNANAWRRILDVHNRQDDSGFYVDPGNNLDVFPVSGSSGLWTNNVFHHVVLTDAAGTVKGYLDGVLQFTLSTTVMDISNPQNVVNFFLDNVAGGGQGEFSNGKVGLIRLYSGALTDSEVASLAVDPFANLNAVPEPASMIMGSASVLAGLGYWLRRRILVTA